MIWILVFLLNVVNASKSRLGGYSASKDEEQSTQKQLSYIFSPEINWVICCQMSMAKYQSNDVAYER